MFDVFRVPQPALLYLVPSTLGSILFMSWKRKDVKQMWHGSFDYTIAENEER